MPDLSNLPALLLTILTLLATVGGYFALRNGNAKRAQEIAERVISGLTTEVEALRRKIEDLETDRAQQDRVLSTIRYVIKQYGLNITLNGDFVTVSDTSGKSKTAAVRKAAVINPIVPQDDDSDAS